MKEKLKLVLGTFVLTLILAVISAFIYDVGGYPHVAATFEAAAFIGGFSLIVSVLMLIS